MKIVTWNVNSIRKRLEIVTEWLRANEVDVLLVQETKVSDDKFPREAFAAHGYAIAATGEPTRNGVAIIARSAIEDVVTSLPGGADDSQARWIEGTVAGLRVVSVYVPNGTSLDSPNFAYKLAFYERARARISALLEEDVPLCLGGDWNVAPEAIDVHDPKGCDGMICYHPSERACLRALFHLGTYDAFRVIHPERRQFTWWDMRGGSYERNEGLRIDHILLGPMAVDRLEGADVDPKPRAGKGVSDHIPVWCRLAI